MSVTGISYAASTGAENINSIETVQGLTNLVRPLLSLSSVGFALAGKSALGALAAGVVAASDSRLTTWSQRCVEGFKAALGFTPVVGSFVALADGAYGMVSKERLGTGVQVSTDEAQSTFVWGGIGLVLDGLFHIKRNAINTAWTNLREEIGDFVPGMCGVRVRIVPRDTDMSEVVALRADMRDLLKFFGLNPLKGIPGLSTEQLFLLREYLSSLESHPSFHQAKFNFVAGWIDRYLSAIDENLRLRKIDFDEGDVSPFKKIAAK